VNTEPPKYSDSERDTEYLDRYEEGIQRLRDTEDLEDKSLCSQTGYTETLSLCSQFVRAACLESRMVAKGRKMSTTWTFVRLLKCHEKFGDMRAREIMTSVPWNETDFSDAEIIQAVTEWDRVRSRAGKNPLLQALWLADQNPIQWSGNLFAQFKNYRKFLDICYYLQKLQGDDPVYLPVRSLSPLLGVTPRVVSTYRAAAKLYGFLKEVEVHTINRATRFRVQIHRFPPQKEPQ
jgi:hypothetical protein